jgi:hypothetical protein
MLMEGGGMGDEMHRTSLRIWVKFGRNMAIDDCHVDGRRWNGG